MKANFHRGQPAQVANNCSIWQFRLNTLFMSPFFCLFLLFVHVTGFIHPHCGTLHFHECGATEIFCPYSASGIATPPPRPLRPLCPPDLSMLPKSAEYLGIRHFLTLKSDATSATWVKQRPDHVSLATDPGTNKPLSNSHFTMRARPSKKTAESEARAQACSADGI